jgi:hypothetical protein
MMSGKSERGAAAYVVDNDFCCSTYDGSKRKGSEVKDASNDMLGQRFVVE